MVELARHVVENRRHWDGNADKWVASGERAWAQPTPTWGVWGISNDELALLPESLHGLRAIELGCGTGYVSAWMQRLGAEVYAIDISAEQLATAQRLADIYDVELIEWVHGNAETVDQPDESFDFAISEYGAAIWCEPTRWLTEAHRLLKPGGSLVFLGHHPIAMLCAPESGDSDFSATMQRSYFELGEMDWTDVPVDPGGIEFNLPISEWMARFRAIGFDIVDYREVRAPEGAEKTRFWIPAEWSRQFPSEQVWWLRKR